jgi:ABC-type transporter Mla maintaining outer membrane lipid asymmetry permease subunit MlaE
MAVYEGYHAEPTAEGVGLATTRTVVTSAVLILATRLHADGSLFVETIFRG